MRRVVEKGQIWTWTCDDYISKMRITNVNLNRRPAVIGSILESENVSVGGSAFHQKGIDNFEGFRPVCCMDDLYADMIDSYWLLEKEAPPEGFEGYSCMNCYTDFWYVVANQPGNQFKCSQCWSQ